MSKFYEVKRAYLTTLIEVELDAGRMDAANGAIAKLLELAQANKDDVGVVLATSSNASLMALSGKTEAAIVQLSSLEACGAAHHQSGGSVAFLSGAGECPE